MVIDVPTKPRKVPDLKQRDVRETANIATSPTIGDFTAAQHDHTNTAGGGKVDHITGLTSIGTNSHAQIDVHVAGDGSDHSDVSTNTSNIATNDTAIGLNTTHRNNTANPHSVILSDVASAGEGIDFSGSTIQGENATTTNKGIAAFDNADFQVTSGVVTLDANIAKTFDGDTGTATTAIHNIDILGGSGINTVGESNNITISAEDSTAGNKGIVIVNAGEGMDVSYSSGTATISGENATTTNKGIASFSSTDFNVSAGGSVTLDDDILSTLDGDTGTATGHTHNIDILGTANEITTAGSSNDIIISLTSHVSYWTCSGENFKPDSPFDTDHDYDDGLLNLAGLPVNEMVMANVSLPHGAVVTGVNVYGNDAGNTWTLYRRLLTHGAAKVAMASAVVNTQDTSISNATIDNSTYKYFFICGTDGATDDFYGARIRYTTKYV